MPPSDHNSCHHLFIGGSHPTAVGQSLREAAIQQGLAHTYMDYDKAHKAPRLVRSICWHLLGNRPPRLVSFNQAVLAECDRTNAKWVHCFGNLGLTAVTIRRLREKGVRCSIWLTDDPWNKALSSKWITQAIPEYSVVFTPRQANMAELSALAPGRVAYLPFGYDPRYFHPLPDAGPPLHDLFFAGGADQDRATYLAPMIGAGIQVGLYGAYWERFSETRSAGKGYAAPGDLAGLIARSRVCLCLVRQANRDGHCMRTFELAGAGACIIAEDTAEHRAIYGQDGESVVYAADSARAASLCRELLDSPSHRQRMSENALRLASEGGHTYSHRLSTILDTCYSSAVNR